MIYRRRVARAAQALDRFTGDRAWHEDVDRATLSLGSQTRCVLGQLYGHYNSAQAVRFLVTNHETLGAFALRNVPLNVIPYVVLTQAWRRELRRRSRASRAVASRPVYATFDVAPIVVDDREDVPV